LHNDKKPFIFAPNLIHLLFNFKTFKIMKTLTFEQMEQVDGGLDKVTCQKMEKN
jgi:hypothetical protein